MHNTALAPLAYAAWLCIPRAIPSVRCSMRCSNSSATLRGQPITVPQCPKRCGAPRVLVKFLCMSKTCVRIYYHEPEIHTIHGRFHAHGAVCRCTPLKCKAGPTCPLASAAFLWGGWLAGRTRAQTPCSPPRAFPAHAPRRAGPIAGPCQSKVLRSALRALAPEGAGATRTVRHHSSSVHSAMARPRGALGSPCPPRATERTVSRCSGAHARASGRCT